MKRFIWSDFKLSVANVPSRVYCVLLCLLRLFFFLFIRRCTRSITLNTFGVIDLVQPRTNFNNKSMTIFRSSITEKDKTIQLLSRYKNYLWIWSLYISKCFIMLWCLLVSQIKYRINTDKWLLLSRPILRLKFIVRWMGRCEIHST